MRWLTVAGVLLYLTRCNDAGALKCHPGSQDQLCALEKKEISPIQNLIERDIVTVSDESECLPGSEWESNCHRCNCSDSGFAECTKDFSCIAQKNADPILCRPNSTFQRYGDTCLCIGNGMVLCTIQSHTIEKRSPQQECTPGTTFQKQCNTCHCLPDGKFACTKRGCLNENRKEKREISEPKDTSRSARALPETPKACQPGVEFRMDCNKCLCNDEGKDFSCTRIDCAALNSNGNIDSFVAARRKRDTTAQMALECVPGSVFDHECNVCRCTADGLHAACTLKRCNKDVTTEASPAFRCTPGDQFKRDCNDCTCSADGKNVFCTLRLCDELIGELNTH